MDKLSPREIECVCLAGQRFTDKEIAKKLGIAPGTVANNLHRAYAKLGVSDRRTAYQHLGNSYTVQAVHIPEMEELPRSIGIPATTVGGGKPRFADVLYQRYAELGKWRIPPRPMGGRISLIIGWALIWLIIAATGATLLQASTEVLNSYRARQL